MRSIVELLWGFRNSALVLKIFLLPMPNQRHLLQLRKPGLRFFVRNAMDVWSIKETIINRFYFPPDYFNLEQDGTIIDIGAGIGDFSIFAAMMVHQGRVLAFEPFPESFHLLQENIQVNSIANITVSSKAVGAQAGYLYLNAAAANPLQQYARSTTNNPLDIQVDSVSLGDIFENHQLSFCHLLKLDCEGGEYEILFSLAPEIIRQIGAVTMEYHDGITEYNHKDLVDFFRKHGFAVQVRPNSVHSYLGYLYAKREAR